MFKNEILANNISAAVTAHASYRQLHVDEVLADPSRLTQIFINLLTNAMKFVQTERRRDIRFKYGACISSPRSMFPDDIIWAPKGSQADDVTKLVEWGDGEQIYLTFSVKDSGIGIDPQHRLRIFERFKQAHVKTNILYGGSGLGLFVSKRLAERQDGEIGVQSTVGEGSMFAFYVRVRRPPSKPSAVAPIPIQHLPSLPLLNRTNTISSPLRSPGHELGESRKLVERVIHVLLVEDNLINQQVLRKQLQRYKCIVHTANHGADALQQLQSMNCYKDRADDGTPLDIILMDTQMPVMGGVECTKEIRRLQAKGMICRHVPIIAVTANARQEQKDETLAAGSVRSLANNE
jgi:CheY-like chemotaxis protein